MILGEINHYLEYVKHIIDYIVIFILFYAVIVSIINYIKINVKKNIDYTKQYNSLRVMLGNNILFGLEVLIIADIIETIIHPTQDRILILIAIVFIRTFISYFLEREIKHGK